MIRHRRGRLSVAEQGLCQGDALGIEIPEHRCPRMLAERAAKIVFTDEKTVCDIIQRKIRDVILTAPEPEDYQALLDKVAKEFKDSEG